MFKKPMLELAKFDCIVSRDSGPVCSKWRALSVIFLLLKKRKINQSMRYVTEACHTMRFD